MAIAEQARDIRQKAGPLVKVPGVLIEVDFATGEVKPHKSYTHFELVELFGEDYRKKAAGLFIESGDILDPNDLEWVEIGDSRREHPGSDADYLVWMDSPRSKNKLAVSVIPPNSRTRGYHRHHTDPHIMIETYRVNYGNPVLFRDHKDFPLEEGQTIPIWPKEKHMVQNPTNKPAMVSIIIGNGALYSDDNLHVFEE